MLSHSDAVAPSPCEHHSNQFARSPKDLVRIRPVGTPASRSIGLTRWIEGARPVRMRLAPKPEDASAPVRMRLTTTIADQLARLGFKPVDVTVLGLSHMHSDHTGQAAAFSRAQLIMDKADFEALQQQPSPFFTDPSTLRPWLSSGAAKTLISGDYDVFGDGSVVMVALPGHTSGNHGLLVRLPRTGAVLISGDALHTLEQLTSRAMPPSNVSRANSLASIDRIAGIVRETRARLVIQHDEASNAKLPFFPRSAD